MISLEGRDTFLPWHMLALCLSFFYASRPALVFSSEASWSSLVFSVCFLRGLFGVEALQQVPRRVWGDLKERDAPLALIVLPNSFPALTRWANFLSRLRRWLFAWCDYRFQRDGRQSPALATEAWTDQLAIALGRHRLRLRWTMQDQILRSQALGRM